MDGEAGCQVWLARHTPVLPAQLALLDRAERARAERLRSVRARRQLVSARVLARRVLAQALHVPAEEVRLVVRCRRCGGPHGKPAVVGRAVPEFSISHSGDYVAVAVGVGRAVGLDMEDVGRPAPQRIAARILSPEERSRGHGTDSAIALRYLTRKEAVLKATGDGLDVPLRSLTVSAPDTEPALLSASPSHPERLRVWIVDLALPEELVGSVAGLGDEPVRVTLHDGTTLVRTPHSTRNVG